MFLYDIHTIESLTTQPDKDQLVRIPIRLVPHLGPSQPNFLFDVLEHSLVVGENVQLGRYSDRKAMENTLPFKSKVVSRYHAVVWLEKDKKIYIKDTGSSSGTFVNQSRLKNDPQELVDGDLIQLGRDFKGGLESMYRAVKIRLEVNRRQKKNVFALKSFQRDTKRIQECCICLYCIAPFQALFIAPCSHVYHYKCIKPLLDNNHPGFSCPLCRTYSNLDDTVSVEKEEVLQMLSSTKQTKNHL
ncbi:SMAD/FHA domain-containing protein [Sporodiniella umbellata]|nr:SMAD/FHA domain-containing protein [Sporodiniella umbellata]